MRKEMIKRISSVLFALVFTFMSAAVPAMNVHASEAGTVLSIQALMQSILLAGGMNTSGYKYTTSGAKQDFRLLMSAILGHGSASDTARINRMMKQAQELEIPLRNNWRMLRTALRLNMRTLRSARKQPMITNCMSVKRRSGICLR